MLVFSLLLTANGLTVATGSHCAVLQHACQYAIAFLWGMCADRDIFSAHSVVLSQGFQGKSAFTCHPTLISDFTGASSKPLYGNELAYLVLGTVQDMLVSSRLVPK